MIRSNFNSVIVWCLGWPPDCFSRLKDRPQHHKKWPNQNYPWSTTHLCSPSYFHYLNSHQDPFHTFFSQEICSMSFWCIGKNCIEEQKKNLHKAHRLYFFCFFVAAINAKSRYLFPFESSTIKELIFIYRRRKKYSCMIEKVFFVLVFHAVSNGELKLKIKRKYWNFMLWKFMLPWEDKGDMKYEILSWPEDELR